MHHEPERLEAALARSWGRSDAKHLALDLVDERDRSAIVSGACDELGRKLPERLTLRADALQGLREEARAVARGSEGEGAARAGHHAQAITEELRSIEPILAGWSARAEVARPTVRITSVFGPRPIEPTERGVWDRAVTMVASYRHAQSIAADEPSLLGQRPSSAEARSAWEATVTAAGEALRTLQRPGEALERLAPRGHDRARAR